MKNLEFTLKKIDKIDNVAFAWARSVAILPTPSVVADIGGYLYRISNFNAHGSECLTVKLADDYEALELSINLHNKKITLPELANIYKICLRINLDEKNVGIFEKEGVKGDKNFQILSKIILFPESILKYLDEKSVPLKTLGLLASFGEIPFDFVVDYVLKKNPSLQNFKKFVESAADFRSSINSSVYEDGFEFPCIKSHERLEIEKALDKISKELEPNRIFSQDGFETGRISFTADVKNFEEYEKMIKTLTECKDDIKGFLKILEQYDIR